MKDRGHFETLPLLHFPATIYGHHIHHRHIYPASWLLRSPCVLAQPRDETRSDQGMWFPTDALELGHSLLGNILGTHFSFRVLSLYHSHDFNRFCKLSSSRQSCSGFF